jgi:CDP-glucose 4,6-dehydratase
MESVFMDTGFWKNKKVLLTGNTGFKGSWLSLILYHLGAKIYGYALRPNTNPSLFDIASVSECLAGNLLADVRDTQMLKNYVADSKPEIVFHFAAQPLVRESYKSPLETFEINALGTASLLEAVKHQTSVKAVVIITTDKVYENKEWLWGYRENDSLGGFDPYSASKACAEIIVNSYRKSYFREGANGACQIPIASARAGNVIGGGDWSKDRLIPDIIKSIQQQNKLRIRNPQAIRPWQHVLEPLLGYLVLAEKLFWYGQEYAKPWNIGPKDEDCSSVSRICEFAKDIFGDDLNIVMDDNKNPHEDRFLKLDCSTARQLLGWRSYLSVETSLLWTFNWYKKYISGDDPRKLVFEQITSYLDLIRIAPGRHMPKEKSAVIESHFL